MRKGEADLTSTTPLPSKKNSLVNDDFLQLNCTMRAVLV